MGKVRKNRDCSLLRCTNSCFTAKGHLYREMSFFIVELISVLVSTLFTLFDLLGYNGNKGHVFTKKPDLAFWVLTAISG